MLNQMDYKKLTNWKTVDEREFHLCQISHKLLTILRLLGKTVLKKDENVVVTKTNTVSLSK